MRKVSGRVHNICQLVSVLLKLIGNAGGFLVLCLWLAPALAAENRQGRSDTGDASRTGVEMSAIP